MSLPDSLPRSSAFSSFWGDPLEYLRSARERHGNVVGLAEGAPVFSRETECSGSIGIFGEDLARLVLTDIETFRMPVSVSDRYELPLPLKNLNSGLFSMHGERHEDRRRLLISILNAPIVTANRKLIAEGCLRFFNSWHLGMQVRIIEEMRRFALYISQRVLLGETEYDRLSVGSEIQRFFELRRQYATSKGRAIALRKDLISQGKLVDCHLRQQVRRLASDSAPQTECVLARLMAARSGERKQLDEDELVAHANILFMTSSEPVATALVWALVVLSQLPRLRNDLRQEFAQAGLGLDIPTSEEIDRASLLHGVVQEILRLLPPSAILVRLTGRPCRIDTYLLPERCEVVLSPWVEHRNAEHFPRPDVFEPRRWLHTQARPFQFLPFGGGIRRCLGQHLAMYTIKLGIEQTLLRYDPVLAGDQEIDWHINLTLMPIPSPVLALQPIHPGNYGGVFAGPAADLVQFDG